MTSASDFDYHIGHVPIELQIVITTGTCHFGFSHRLGHLRTLGVSECSRLKGRCVVQFRRIGHIKSRAQSDFGVCTREISAFPKVRAVAHVGET